MSVEYYFLLMQSHIYLSASVIYVNVPNNTLIKSVKEYARTIGEHLQLKTTMEFRHLSLAPYVIRKKEITLRLFLFTSLCFVEQTPSLILSRNQQF